LERFFGGGEARGLWVRWGGGFQFVLMEERGPPVSRIAGREGVVWRAAETDPMRCSRARREALVSRAKRGTESRLMGLMGVEGVCGAVSLIALVEAV